MDSEGRPGKPAPSPTLVSTNRECGETSDATLASTSLELPEILVIGSRRPEIQKVCGLANSMIVDGRFAKSGSRGLNARGRR
jgi:hypothetical protein